MTRKKHGKRKSGTNERKTLVNQIKKCVRQMRSTSNEKDKRIFKKRADNAWRQIQRIARQSGGKTPHIDGYQSPNH